MSMSHSSFDEVRRSFVLRTRAGAIRCTLVMPVLQALPINYE